MSDDTIRKMEERQNALQSIIDRYTTHEVLLEVCRARKLTGVRGEGSKCLIARLLEADGVTSPWVGTRHIFSGFTFVETPPHYKELIMDFDAGEFPGFVEGE